MKILRVVADDFGMSPAASDGICEAIEWGIAAATSAMVCVPGAIDSLERYAPRIAGRIGLHFQLTAGVPCAPAAAVPSLVDGHGRFRRRREDLASRLAPAEVARELEAQLARLRSLGIEPTHVDSHHHVHQLPGVLEAYADFARRHALPARGGNARHAAVLRRRGVATADVFCTRYFGAGLDPDSLLRLLSELEPTVPDGGTLELMAHPGRVDDALRAISGYQEPREVELATLCHPELPARVRALGFAIAGWERNGSS